MQDAEGTQATDEAQTEDSEAAVEVEGGAERRDYGKTAEGHVRRARKSLTEGDWQHDERASFFLASSKVYALLDLADAIRGTDHKDS